MYERSDVSIYQEVMGYLRDQVYAEGYREGLNECHETVIEMLCKYLILRFGQSAEYLHDDLYTLSFVRLTRHLKTILNMTDIREIEQVLQQIRVNEQDQSPVKKGFTPRN